MNSLRIRVPGPARALPVPLAALVAFACSVGGPSLARAEEGAPKVFVVRPRLVDVGEAALPAIMDAIGLAAQDEGVQAVTENDVAEILRNQATLQALGSDADELSLASLGKAVGATHLVTATVTKTKDDTVVSCRLVDTAGARVLARREVKASEHGDSLLDAVKVATKLVVSPVFAHRKGTVKLTVSESGADVLVDGDVRGTTPMGPFEVTGGTHLLGVRKERFVSHAETLRIVGGEVVERLVVLKPSPDYLRQYKEDAARMRIVAWTGTAVLVVGAAATVFAAMKYGAADAEINRLTAEYDALSGLEKQNRKSEYEGKLAAPTADRTLGFNLMIGGGIVAGAGLVAGGIGWIFGDDPGRYDALEK